MNMFLPYRLLSLELTRNDCTHYFLQYRKSLEKVEKNQLRVKFINSCLQADVIPRFLKFRVPNNGAFDQNSVFEFQKALLRKELYKAKQHTEVLNDKVSTKRQLIQVHIPEYLLSSIAVHSRFHCRDVRRSVKNGHNKKLLALSEEQQRPLFSVQNTVILHELDETPPKYVMDTLSLGPKNSVLEKLNPHDVLAKLDGLLNFCKDNNVTEDVISDINIKTIAYIKKCKKQVSNRNVQATKRYLKEKSLLAVPFDKGVGICVMKRQAYEDKLSSILQLPQFEKLEQTRKNEKHPVRRRWYEID